MTNNASDVKQNTVETKSFYISIFAPLMGLQEFQKYVQDGYVLDISQSPRKRGNNVHLTLVKTTPVSGEVKADDVVVEDKPKTTTTKKATVKTALNQQIKREWKMFNEGYGLGYCVSDGCGIGKSCEGWGG